MSRFTLISLTACFFILVFAPEFYMFLYFLYFLSMIFLGFGLGKKLTDNVFLNKQYKYFFAGATSFFIISCYLYFKLSYTGVLSYFPSLQS